MPITVVPMTEKEKKENEKRFPTKKKESKKKKPQKAAFVGAGIGYKKTGGIVKRMGGGKTSKYRAKGGRVK